MIAFTVSIPAFWAGYVGGFVSGALCLLVIGNRYSKKHPS